MTKTREVLDIYIDLSDRNAEIDLAMDALYILKELEEKKELPAWAQNSLQGLLEESRERAGKE